MTKRPKSTIPAPHKAVLVELEKLAGDLDALMQTREIDETTDGMRLVLAKNLLSFILEMRLTGEKPSFPGKEEIEQIALAAQLVALSRAAGPATEEAANAMVNDLMAAMYGVVLSADGIPTPPSTEEEYLDRMLNTRLRLTIAAIANATNGVHIKAEDATDA